MDSDYFAGGFVLKAIGRELTSNDIFGVDLPDQTGDFLFHLPLSIDEKNGDNKDDEEGTQNAGCDLRMRNSVIRFAAFLVIVAARRLIERRSFSHPCYRNRLRKYLFIQRYKIITNQ